MVGKTNKKNLTLGLVSAVADELDGVVDGDVLVVGAVVEDAAEVEAEPGGVDGHGEGADVGEVVHDGGVVVAGELLEAAYGGNL